MKKLNNGVVPPVPTFHFERIRIAKEGNNHHENEYMARGGDRRTWLEQARTMTRESFPSEWNSAARSD